ncbi:hypothetical protein BGZ74_008777 [Mortierella antarctica]|nr:hypothetical protein BGZ74_008777 [Mortierella antarctica]
MPTTKIILENIFGMLGIVFWSFQLLPQAIDNYKRKSTEGLSYSMFAIWSLCAVGFGAYSVVQELSIPIIIQPQVFGFLSTLCYLQCLYYGRRTRWSLKKTVVGGILLYMGMVVLEVVAIYGTRAGLDHQVKGTIEAAGIIPIVLLALGFFPQYFDIYRDRAVIGVSMAFIAADGSGAVFSLISLAFREEFDVLAGMNYVVVLICDLIVVAFFVYYNKMNPQLARATPEGKKIDNTDVENVASSSSDVTQEATVVSRSDLEQEHRRLSRESVASDRTVAQEKDVA